MPAAIRHTVTARLRKPVDFERVLRNRSHAQTAHFAVHYVAGQPAVRTKVSPPAEVHELSTGDAPMLNAPGDKSSLAGADDRLPIEQLPLAAGFWLGMVVPKRHAKRSVTRSLMKRQIRAAVAASSAAMPSGLWVVRLRAPFDRALFPSAASTALLAVVRAELDQLLQRVAQRRPAV